MAILRVTKEHEEQALAQLRAEGYLGEYAGLSLYDVMASPLPGRFIRLRAVAIAKGACTAPAPTHHRPQVIAPEAPAHTHWQPPQPPKARPARQQAQLFDARRAASGDRDD
jgi:hypothetical protein